MKHPATLLILFLSLLQVRGYGANPSPGNGSAAVPTNVVNERINASIGSLLKTADQPTLKRGNTAVEYAMGCLYLNQNVDQANQLILDYCKANPVIPEAKITALRYPLMEFCVYLTPECRAHLTPEVKATLEKRAWNWAFLRSRISGVDRSLNHWEGGFNTMMSEWNLAGSENHQGEWTATNLVSLAIIRQAGAPYGPQAKLGDGHTVEEHFQGWQDYWTRYIRSRAKEGLDCEIAQPSSYGHGTLLAYYKVRDFADSPALKSLATNFLDLYWANVASEFEPRTGIRSACASTRCYKAEWQQLGSLYWAGPLLMTYDWWTPAPGMTGRQAEPQFDLMPFYTSAYRPPAILQKIASDMNRQPYQATSRRFGRGVGPANIDRMITFDDGALKNSYIRRDVYYTPDYTISANSFDSTRSYIESVRQARVMGITFSKDVNARILLYGDVQGGKGLEEAEAEHKQLSSAGVNGFCGPGVLIGGRDPKANDKDSVRLFVSNNVWANHSEGSDGLIFTELGGAYGAIRIAAGGYTIKPAPNKTGVFLLLKDKWSPIAIQMGRAIDYKTLDAFKAAVRAEKYSYADNNLSLVSLAGVHYEFSTRTTDQPQINGSPLDLNPRKTYDTPFVTMEHGSSMATISYPGSKPVVLDFSSHMR